MARKREGSTKVTDWSIIMAIKPDLLIPIRRRMPLSNLFCAAVIFSNE